MRNDEKPTHIDLFSGIGGFALAAKWAGFRTVAFCEIDKYCQKVIAKNFLPKSDAFGRNGRSDNEGAIATERAWPSISSDIFDFDGTAYCGCSLVTGGFPCQPFSVAGKRRGAADDRHLWPEMLRVINEARPAFVLGENVPGIITMELDNVLSDLESIGYASRPFVIPACAVDARHRRDRLWIVCRNISNAGSRRFGGPREGEIQLEGRTEIVGASEELADANESGSQGRIGESLRECAGERVVGPGCASIPDAEAFGWGQGPPNSRGLREGISENERSGFTDGCRWLVEPDVGRVAHGVSRRVDRLKGLGNAIVPQVAYEILREIRKLI